MVSTVSSFLTNYKNIVAPKNGGLLGPGGSTATSNNTGFSSIGFDYSQVPAGVASGIQSGGLVDFFLGNGQQGLLTKDQAVNAGFINPGDDRDLQGVKRFTSFQSSFPDVVKQLNDNFSAIAQTFSKVGATVDTQAAGTNKITTSLTGNPQGLPGQSLTDSLGAGFGQAGNFLKSNPLLLLVGVGVLALVVLRK